MQPVGNTIIPPNPNAALNTLSSIVGLQQQRQALQTGQYQQATAQAQSQQAGQQNQELQALATFTHNAAKDPSYLLPDGTPDVTKFQQGAMSVAPTYGQQYIGQMTSNFQEAAQTRRTMQALATDQNTTITNGLKGLANIPGGATRTDVLNWKDQIESNNKDPAFHRAVDNMVLGMTPDPGPGGGYSGSAARIAAGMGGLSMQEPGQMNLGGAVQPGTTRTLGPGVGQFSPVGAATPTVTPATNTTNAAGQLVHVPTGGTGLPSTAGPPGTVNPTNAAAAAQTDDNTRYKQISDAAQMSQTGQNLARNVALLAKGVQTGKFSGEATDWLTTLRQHDPGLTNRQLLNKYSAQLQQMALGVAGSDTDLSRGVVLHGMPAPESMGPDAIVDASRYIQGLMGMAGARSQVASNYVKANGGSPVGLRANADQNFMQNANPDVFAARQIPAGKERQEWLSKHGYTDPTAKAQLLQQSKVMDQYGVQ